MSVLWRIMSVASLAVSGGILLFSVLTVRREARVRPRLELLRLGVTVLTTILMSRFLGIATPEALMGVGLVGGLLLGVYEGLHLRVRFLAGVTFARRTWLGVAAWSVGVLAVQLAGVLGRAGVADFGLAMSFFGIGQVTGLLAGRWETITRLRGRAAPAAAAICLVLLGASLLAGGGPAAWSAEGVDLRAVAAGDVEGLSLRVTGSGLGYYGPALRLHFVNDTREAVQVAVPVGLQFVPEDDALQTMIAAGGETITVPGGGRAAQVPESAFEIQAFCGQDHDRAAGSEDLFHPGALVSGGLLDLIRLINQGGVYGFDQQLAVWNFTDGFDVTGNEAAAGLVAGAGGQAGGSAGAVEDGALSAGEGAGAAAAGLGGSALVLLSTLSAAGESPAALASAWRTGKVRGLRDLAAGPRGDGAALGVVASGDGPRATAALEAVPADLKSAVREAVDAAAAERAAQAVLRTLETPHPPAGGSAEALLAHVPGSLRLRVSDLVEAGLRESRLAAAEAAAAQESLARAGEMDVAADLPGSLRQTGLLERWTAALPAPERPVAEGRIIARLESDRLSRWVDKLRAAATPAAAAPPLEGPEAQHLLAGLSGALREQVERHVSGALEEEVVQRLIGEAQAAVRRERAVELLRAAMGLNDGDGADAVTNAMGAATDASSQSDLEALLRRAVVGGKQALANLSRRGIRRPPPDLTEHLAGEADLRAAVLGREEVAEALAPAGRLRSRVEEGLVASLEQERIDRAVAGAAAELSPVARAAADVMSAVQDVPGARRLIDGLAAAARPEAYKRLAERLVADRLEIAVAQVSGAAALDGAEQAVRRAAQAGDLAAAEAILAGLPPGDAAALEGELSRG